MILHDTIDIQKREDANRCSSYVELVVLNYNFNEFRQHFRQISFLKITKDIQSNNNNNIVVSSGRALCLLTLGHISAYNMDNTILLYK